MIGKLLKKAFTPVWPLPKEQTDDSKIKNHHTLTLNSIRKPGSLYMTDEQIEHDGYEVVGEENGVKLIRKKTK